jgi:CRP/FNR family cyclic AMP-dependent transcriptional regulator
MTLVRLPASLPLQHDPRLCARLRAAPGASVRHVCGRDRVLRDGGATGAILVEAGAVTLAAGHGSWRPSILAVLGPGELVPCRALRAAGSHPPGLPARAEEIRALVPSRVLVVPAPGLQEASAADPELAWSLAAALASALTSMEQRLARTLGLPVAGRLLDLLRELASKFGRPAPGGRRVDLPLRQEDLASMVGATRESVNRAMAALAADGHVGRSGRLVVVRYQEADPG